MYTPDDSRPDEPPPVPRLSGPGPAIMGVSLLVLSVVVFAVVLGALGLIPNPFASSPQPLPIASPAVTPTPTVQPSPGRFAQEGDCIVNSGTDQSPQLLVVECSPGALVVLRRFEDTSDVKVCEPVNGYRYHYFFDSQLPGLDFVLCMGERP